MLLNLFLPAQNPDDGRRRRERKLCWGKQQRRELVSCCGSCLWSLVKAIGMVITVLGVRSDPIDESEAAKKIELFIINLFSLAPSSLSLPRQMHRFEKRGSPILLHKVHKKKDVLFPEEITSPSPLPSLSSPSLPALFWFDLGRVPIFRGSFVPSDPVGELSSVVLFPLIV